MRSRISRSDVESRQSRSTVDLQLARRAPGRTGPGAPPAAGARRPGRSPCPLRASPPGRPPVSLHERPLGTYPRPAARQWRMVKIARLLARASAGAAYGGMTATWDSRCPSSGATATASTSPVPRSGSASAPRAPSCRRAPSGSAPRWRTPARRSSRPPHPRRGARGPRPRAPRVSRDAPGTLGRGRPRPRPGPGPRRPLRLPAPRPARRAGRRRRPRPRRRAGRFAYDTMTLIGPGTWEAARAAVDAALTAAALVAAASAVAYACCRPPGHHATRDALRRVLLPEQRRRGRSRGCARRPAGRSPCSTSTPITATARRRSSTRTPASCRARSTSIRAPAGSPTSSASPPRAAGVGRGRQPQRLPRAGLRRRDVARGRRGALRLGARGRRRGAGRRARGRRGGRGPGEPAAVSADGFAEAGRRWARWGCRRSSSRRAATTSTRIGGLVVEALSGFEEGASSPDRPVTGAVAPLQRDRDDGLGAV